MCCWTGFDVFHQFGTISLLEKNPPSWNERHLQHCCQQSLLPGAVLIRPFGAAVESQSGIAHHPYPTISLSLTCQAALIQPYEPSWDDKWHLVD